MNGRDLLEAMGFVNDHFVDEAENARMGKTTHHWARWTSIAACVCIAAVSLWLRMGYGGADSGSTANDGAAFQYSSGTSTQAAISGQLENESADGMTDAEEAKLLGVTIPPMEVELGVDRGVSMDMSAFFIYQGRSYVQDQRLEDSGDLVGAYLGTATGLINEWTPREGYVDLAGSVSGDFYAVEGMDPEFMLCMKQDNGAILTFINNNGLTLTLGTELFEDRLHLSGNYSAVEFRAYDQKAATKLDESHYETLEQFLSALNGGQFLYSDEVPLIYPAANPSETVEGTCLYQVAFRMGNGLSWELLLHRGGYISFSGLRQACVQVDPEIFGELLDILDQEGP